MKIKSGSIVIAGPGTFAPNREDIEPGLSRMGPLALEPQESRRNDHQATRRFLAREPQGAWHPESVEMGEAEVLCDQGGSVMIE